MLVIGGEVFSEDKEECELLRLSDGLFGGGPSSSWDRFRALASRVELDAVWAAMLTIRWCSFFESQGPACPRYREILMTKPRFVKIRSLIGEELRCLHRSIWLHQRASETSRSRVLQASPTRYV